MSASKGVTFRIFCSSRAEKLGAKIVGNFLAESETGTVFIFSYFGMVFDWLRFGNHQSFKKIDERVNGVRSMV